MAKLKNRHKHKGFRFSVIREMDKIGPDRGVTKVRKDKNRGKEGRCGGGGGRFVLAVSFELVIQS